MAVPALLGVGAITGLITAIVSKIAEWLAEYLSKKAALAIAIISAYVALLVGLAMTISTILGGIATALPGDLAQGIAMIAPSNFSACVSAIYSTKVAIWVYDQKKQLLDWQVQQ